MAVWDNSHSLSMTCHWFPWGDLCRCWSSEPLSLALNSWCLPLEQRPRRWGAAYRHWRGWGMRWPLLLGKSTRSDDDTSGVKNIKKLSDRRVVILSSLHALGKPARWSEKGFGDWHCSPKGNHLRVAVEVLMLPKREVLHSPFFQVEF